MVVIMQIVGQIARPRTADDAVGTFRQSWLLRFHELSRRRFRPCLRGLYQIPEPGGNHTKRFTDNTAFEAFRFTFRLPERANMIAEPGGKPPAPSDPSVESAVP
jgi:hypothetical protein